MKSIIFRRRSVKYMATLLICGAMLLISVTVVLGRPFRMWRLPDSGRNFGCGVCHVRPGGGGERNPFGQDYEKIGMAAGDQYTADLGALDSDGDGASNDQEFDANTHPGDAESKPAGAAPKAEPTKALPNYLYRAGKLLALIGFVFILFQYVLSSRIRLIERRIGLDKLFRIHRKFGVVGLVLIFVHPVLLYIAGALQDYPLSLPPLKIVGIVAWLILLTAAGAAILYNRLHLKYETWKRVHKAAYVILPLGFIHSFFMGSDLHRWPLRILWIIMACIYVIVVIYRVWNWSRVKGRPLEVTAVSQDSQDVWSLYFEGEHKAYNPGQFMIVRLKRGGKTSEPHPFTISSSPTRDSLSISVKSVGDFTATIGDTKVGDTAYVEAPYGVFSFLNHDAQDLVFIAGGIGITPFMSMLRYIYDKKLGKNVILIWGNKTEQDIVFRDELEKMAAEMPSLKVMHVMSKQDDWPGEKGYVDSEKLKKYISDFQKGQFFLCGPPRMMLLMEKTLRDLGVSKKRIHYERFALR